MSMMQSSGIFMPGGPVDYGVVEAKKEIISQFWPHSYSTTWNLTSKEEIGPLSS